MKRLRIYREYLKIREKFHELLKASATVSTEKFNQSKSKEIFIRSKDTSKKKSFSVDSLNFFSSFLNFAMFRNSRSIMNCFLFFRNWNWVCRRVVLIIVFCIFAFVLNIFRWTSKRSWRTRSFLIFTRFHSTAEKIRSHFRSRRTHFTHLFDFSFTRHFLFRRLQFSQERITMRSNSKFCKQITTTKSWRFNNATWRHEEKQIWFLRRKS